MRSFIKLENFTTPSTQSSPRSFRCSLSRRGHHIYTWVLFQMVPTILWFSAQRLDTTCLKKIFNFISLNIIAFIALRTNTIKLLSQRLKKHLPTVEIAVNYCHYLLKANLCLKRGSVGTWRAWSSRFVFTTISNSYLWGSRRNNTWTCTSFVRDRNRRY